MSFWPIFGAGLDGSAPGIGGGDPASTGPIVLPTPPRPQENLALMYENRVDLDGVKLAGGKWQPGTLGLANLRTPYLPEVARTLNTDPADTRFSCTLPKTFSVGGIALGPTNLRATAQLRIRSYQDEGKVTLMDDSGMLSLPTNQVDQLTLAWEDPGFWEGVTQEFDDIGKGIGKGATFIYIPKFRFVAGYFEVEIFDKDNPDGYIDVGRFFVSRTWRPPKNYEVESNSLDFEAITDEEVGRSGTLFHNPRALRRTFKFGFSYLPETEFREIYQIAVRSGINNQVVVVPNPGDPSTFLREAFIGTLGVPPSLRRMSTPNIATEFVAKESL
jgi:hypothetical protein